MKVIGYVIIAVSLTIGAIGASTAYLAALALPDEALVRLTLSDPVWGEVERASPDADDTPGEPDEFELPAIDPGEPLSAAENEEGEGSAADDEPLAAAGDVLTTELLGRLRDAGVRHVRVESFDFGRWQGKWLTLGGIAGLIIGAALLRMRARAVRAAVRSAPQDAATSPEALIDAAREALLGLHRAAAEIAPGEARAAHILRGAAEIQRAQINPIVDGRERLRARLGLAGYARFMDRFAAGERQVNRAWSAAADEDHAEAMRCLPLAAESLGEARERL